MKSNTLTDPLDTSDGLFNAAGDGIFVNLSPAVGYGGGSPFPNIVPVIVPQEAAQAETAVAASGSGGAGSVVAETSGSGFTVNLLFDAAAMAAPASFRAGIEQAASILAATISDKITVNIKIDYSGTGGGAAAGPDNGQYESYSSIRADLINNATPGDQTFNALPSGSTVQGQSSIAVWNAQLKLFGLMSANSTTTDDGSATFSTDINSNLLVGVALHELTHAMGRVPYGAPYSSSPDIFDLYRFTSAGTVLINGASTAPAAYFSVDGGITKIADFGQNSDPSDFLNSGVQGGNDPFNEYYSGGTLQSLTTADKEMLDALGFHTAPPVTTTVIEALGSTSLVQVGSNYFLDPVSGGTGPELKYQGAPIVAGQWGAWAPIAAETTASGYEVAWKLVGADQYTVWNTDSAGNDTTNTIGTVSGSSTALESLEISFHQDLNGDGVIGIPTPVTIEALGSTSLVQVGSNYFLDPVSGGTGPELKYQGAPIAAGQWAGWAPIGAEATATGYEVAWKLAGADQYTVWNTDSNGNDTTNTIGTVSGSSTALESLEISFHQDLNGDGVIGIPTPVTIESFGSTSLVQVGSNYFLDPVSGGTGPELKYQGAPIVAGQWGAWAPIGAEATASGYEVAWKLVGADQYTVWNTDSNGNDSTNTIGTVSGSSTALESLETSFHQDLNGDGVIGIPSTTSAVIESFGSTSLVQVGSNYFLNPVSGGTGPELKYQGAPIVAGQWGGWAPIGAEATASGYEVAWKLAGADQYTVWNTDSTGNDTINTIGTVSGSSTALESLETSFHQDLNGDGVIGVPAAQAPAVTSSSPVLQAAAVTIASNDTFVFHPGFGASVIANTGGADTIELDGFSSVASDAQLTVFLHEAQGGLSQNLFQSANGGQDVLINLGNHDSITLVNVHVADLHASGFIIH